MLSRSARLAFMSLKSELGVQPGCMFYLVPRLFTQNSRHLPTAFYSSSSSTDNAAEVQALQGPQEHEFSPSRAREILSAVIESGEISDDQKSSLRGVEVDANEEGEPTDRPYDAHGSVSLHSVMQSNVPEPFSPSEQGNPTHMNMPGGGMLRHEKYVSGTIQETHPRHFHVNGDSNKRKYSTSAAAVPRDPSVQGAQDATINVYDSFDRPATQGIQGDACVSFRLWLQNCAFYGLDCENQAEEFKEGRKTLAQIFDEQEIQIKEVAERYRSVAAASAAGIQGLQSDKESVAFAKILQSFDAPCPQGIQGDDCEQFKVWLENCGKFGFGAECEKAFQSVKSGRKTLHQIFAEQEAAVKMVQKRSYSTSSGSNPEVTPASVKLSQKDRLKKVVKEYGGTVVVFHVCISLVSLGSFYALVSSGIDVIAILSKLGVGESILNSKITTGASTFVVAYAVHKVFAPVRIACTLTCTPFIVRYLRGIGFLKKPAGSAK